MVLKKIDTRGLSCPQPLILVQKAVKSGFNDLEVLADLNVAKENIIRCASFNKLNCRVEEKGNEFVITIREQK